MLSHNAECLLRGEDFNQQYSETHNQNLDYVINMEPIKDLKIDLTGGKTYASSLNENFHAAKDTNGDGLIDYTSLFQNSFGNFNISTSLIKTAFSQSDGVTISLHRYRIE